MAEENETQDPAVPYYTPEEDEKIYQVRLLIGDSPSSPFYPLFDDDEIAMFLKMNSWNVRRASRQAAISASMNFSQMVYRERTGDIEVWNNVSLQYLKALENVINGRPEDFGTLRPYFGGVETCVVKRNENDPSLVRSPLVAFPEDSSTLTAPLVAIGSTNEEGDTDYLLVNNHLGEFRTQYDKTAARINLELQNIDGGTFN